MPNLFFKIPIIALSREKISDLGLPPKKTVNSCYTRCKITHTISEPHGANNNKVYQYGNSRVET